MDMATCGHGLHRSSNIIETGQVSGLHYTEEPGIECQALVIPYIRVRAVVTGHARPIRPVNQLRATGTADRMRTGIFPDLHASKRDALTNAR